MTQFFKNLNGLTTIIEGYGEYPLNTLVASNPSANLIMVVDGAGDEIDTWDITEILDSGSAQAGVDVATTLAYLLTEFNDTIENLSTADVTVIADASAAAAVTAFDHSNFLDEAAHDALPADNPHSVTLTQTVAADAGTDVTVAELETLTDGSNADALHTHTATTPIFGSEYQKVASIVASVTTAQPSSPNDITTGTFPAQYLTLTTPALPAGDYLVSGMFTFNHDSQGNDFVSRLNRNTGAELVLLTRVEPKDSAGGNAADAPAGSGTNQRIAAPIYHIFDGISGVQTFELEFATSVNGVESTMIEGTLAIWRLA